MSTVARLSDMEYEALGLEYEQNPPKLSGTPGFLTALREQVLVTELLPHEYARIVKTKAIAMSLSPSEVIQYAIKAQFAGNVHE
ncbi:MAG: hypothetical protein FWH17_04890 [Oscillospiraceae bacterium]|nr:hypothetical protein [Oscillospiraceae bacterium]